MDGKNMYNYVEKSKKERKKERKELKKGNKKQSYMTVYMYFIHLFADWGEPV